MLSRTLGLGPGTGGRALRPNAAHQVSAYSVQDKQLKALPKESTHFKILFFVLGGRRIAIPVALQGSPQRSYRFHKGGRCARLRIATCCTARARNPAIATFEDEQAAQPPSAEREDVDVLRCAYVRRICQARPGPPHCGPPRAQWLQ